jgi:hypothetical protein
MHATMLFHAPQFLRLAAASKAANKPILLFGGAAAVIIGGVRYFSRRRQANDGKGGNQTGSGSQPQGIAGSGLILVVVGAVMLLLALK